MSLVQSKYIWHITKFSWEKWQNNWEQIELVRLENKRECLFTLCDSFEWHSVDFALIHWLQSGNIFYSTNSNRYFEIFEITDSVFMASLSIFKRFYLFNYFRMEVSISFDSIRNPKGNFDNIKSVDCFAESSHREIQPHNVDYEYAKNENVKCELSMFFPLLFVWCGLSYRRSPIHTHTDSHSSWKLWNRRRIKAASRQQLAIYCDSFCITYSEENRTRIVKCWAAAAFHCQYCGTFVVVSV